MSFRLVPKSVTLNDLALFRRVNATLITNLLYRLRSHVTL